MTPEQEEFVRRMLWRALVERKDTPLWKGVWMTAIACHESGWGKHFPEGSYNYIGYHWVHGLDWEYVEATEGGTGRSQRYRKFASIIDMFTSLRYLIERSRLPGYVEARNLYERHGSRRTFIRGFSIQYCPADPNHGIKVLAIYRQLLAALAL